MPQADSRSTTSRDALAAFDRASMAIRRAKGILGCWRDAIVEVTALRRSNALRRVEART